MVPRTQAAPTRDSPDRPVRRGDAELDGRSPVASPGASAGTRPECLGGALAPGRGTESGGAGGGTCESPGSAPPGSAVRCARMTPVHHTGEHSPPGLGAGKCVGCLKITSSSAGAAGGSVRPRGGGGRDRDGSQEVEAAAARRQAG